MSFELVEQAWKLSEDALAFAKAAGRELAPADYWQPFFAPSPLVDVERTTREGGNPPTKIFLKSPYGLEWRVEHKDWIPFRHGPVKLEL